VRRIWIMSASLYANAINRCAAQRPDLFALKSVERSLGETQIDRLGQSRDTAS
jgi:hypothetical protein